MSKSLQPEEEFFITAEYTNEDSALESDAQSKTNERTSGVNQNRVKLAVGLSVLFIILVLVSIVTASIVSDHRESTRRVPSGVTVVTDCGRVKGHASRDVSDVSVFKGIPYAVPPVGKRRWKPPTGLKDGNECWKGVFEAKEFASPCAQPNGEKVSGKEDCLYVNVFTPSVNKGANLPVLVWIHGGDLVMGSAHGTFVLGYYPTAKFVHDIGVVAVSFNYRLNAFGFMALDVLSEASPTKTSGNYGFMDQILALKWVQKNIENFGGDKTRVTVLGHSSGGTSIFGLLASDSAQGLFQNVISMSGSPVFNKTTKDASKDNLIFVKNSKCERKSSGDTLKCLYNLSISEVLHAIPWKVFPYWAMEDLNGFPIYNHFDGALAVVDGDVVKFPPGELPYHELSGKGMITVVIGTTAQEIGFQPNHNFSGKSYEMFVAYTMKKFSKFLSKEQIQRALKLYSKMQLPPESLLKSRAQYVYDTMASDMRVICPNDVLARNISRSKRHTVYRYVTNAIPSRRMYPNHKFQFSFHGVDCLAFFGYQVTQGYQPQGRDLTYVKLMQKQLKHILYYGHPITNQWRRFPLETAVITGADVEFTGPKGYHPQQCDFMIDHGFFPYAWIN